MVNPSPGEPSLTGSGPDLRSGPVRTCIGCRTRRPDHELVRVALLEGDFVIDQRGTGRGAWLCRDEACVTAAGKTKAFSRALRSKLADAVFADTLLGWLGKLAH